MQYLGSEWKQYFFGVLMVDIIEYHALIKIIYLISFSIEYHAFEMFNSPMRFIKRRLIVSDPASP